MCLTTCQFRNDAEEIDVVDVLDLDESPSFEVCCDSCDRWYHGRCVGITQDYADSISFYTCPPCETKAKSRKIFVIIRPQVAHDSPSSSSSSSHRAVEIKTPLLENDEEESTSSSQSKKKAQKRKRKQSADPDWIDSEVTPKRQSGSTSAPGKAGIDEANDIWIYQSEDDNAIGDDDEEEGGQDGDKKPGSARNIRPKPGPDLQQSPGSHQRVKITLATTPPGRGDSRAVTSPQRTKIKMRSQKRDVVGSATRKNKGIAAPTGRGPFATLNPDCLITVFSFLDALDLCRSVQVCRHWRTVGEHGSLWKRVNVRLSSIGDWSLLTRFLLTKKTLKQLSLQGDTPNQSAWDPKPLALLKHVTSLYLHEAPVEVAHRIPELMPHLAVFWCENIQFSIGDYSIDFGRFKNLPKLTELCIHSPEPFQLPAFSFQGNLSQLKSLTSLTTLVISNIEGQVFNEFSFVRGLRNLTSLTVGFCFEWTHDTYESVSDLKNLRYLSLNGLPVKMEDAGLDLSLVTCLTHFPHLEELELIDFFIPQALVNKPGTLRNLQSLRLIDSSQCQTGQEKLTVIQHLNYERTLSLLKCLEGLRRLTWHAHGSLMYLEEAERWQEDVAVILPRTLSELQGHGEFVSSC